MDLDDIMPVGLLVFFLVFIVGVGWLISRDQDADQARALACIESGQQFVGGDCVAGPKP